VLLPITADEFAIQGLATLLEDLKRYKRYNNPELEVLDLVLNRAQRNRQLTQHFAADLQQLYGSEVPMIPEASAVGKAQATGEPVISLLPNETVSDAFRRYVETLIVRMEGD
jgi:chromosome partitioning protein